MNKLKIGLLGIVFPALLSVFGCSNLSIGGRDYKCLYNSRYSDSHIKKAEKIEEKLRENPNLEDKKQAVYIHGDVGNLKLMDKYVEDIIKKTNASTGELYDWIGKQYHKAHKHCKHEMDFLK